MLCANAARTLYITFLGDLYADKYSRARTYRHIARLRQARSRKSDIKPSLTRVPRPLIAPATAAPEA
jgi:hypothetical protein